MPERPQALRQALPAVGVPEETCVVQPASQHLFVAFADRSSSATRLLDTPMNAGASLPLASRKGKKRW